MRLCRNVLAVILALMGACPAAGDEVMPRVFLSGFMDLQWEPDADGTTSRVHRLGQAEFDLDAEIAPGVGLCLAPAWDPVTEAFGVGMAAVTLQFTPGDPAALCRGELGGQTGLMAGRFDVPFGIDWLFYPSIDRPLVTMPLPVAATHGGWNADGVMAYGAAGPWNGIIHATTGFDHSRVLDSGGEGIWTGRQAVGGRLGVALWPGVSLGASAAGIEAVEDQQRQFLAGWDLFVERGPATLRGELLRLRPRGPEEHLDHGWYVAAQWDFGAAYGIVRWDEWRPEGLARERRLSLGAGVPVRGAVVLRGEYELWPDAGRADRLVLQVAAGFSQ
ncbi:MAG: hypothetical protein ABR506_07930 [Candidatus Krumholzibacteriia bacterium]